jgi:D-glycero-D-manno-heptose 1,7-bisphosphate phosphatase
MRPAVFLDRDGVLIDEAVYLSEAQQVALIPGAAAAVRKLNDAGFAMVVVTNQSGVARGYFPESQVAVVHDHISQLLRDEAGARIDRFDHSPFHPDATVLEYKRDSDCRKPKPGMLLRSAATLGLDLPRSWMVGDRRTDLEAGAAAGCRTILVQTGYGTEQNLSAPDATLKLVAVVPTVVEAVGHILAAESRPNTECAGA